jgi:hypothetical protein
MHGQPVTARELRAACRAFPRHRVFEAVDAVLRQGGWARTSADALAMCCMIAGWLTGASDDDPPPLSPTLVEELWRGLSTDGEQRTN